MGFKNKTFLNNNPPELEDDDLNLYKDEFNNVITSSGQTPDNGILDQTAKGISAYLARGDFYTDSGAADAYILTIVGTQFAPLSYESGMRIRFVPTNDNTGASTINVATLGVKNIKLADGGDPVAEDIKSGLVIEMFYDGTDFVVSEIISRIRGYKSFRTSEAALTGTYAFIGVQEWSIGAGLIWPKNQLTSGKVFASFQFNKPGGAGEVADVRLKNDAGTVILEHTGMAIGNPGSLEFTTPFIDVSAANVTALDLTTTNLHAVNALATRHRIEARTSPASGSMALVQYSFWWER